VGSARPITPGRSGGMRRVPGPRARRTV